jgi:hypothetical protein
LALSSEFEKMAKKKEPKTLEKRKKRGKKKHKKDEISAS